MVKPEGASHWMGAGCFREVLQLSVSVWPSSTVMVSTWLVRKASVEQEHEAQSVSWGQAAPALWSQTDLLHSFDRVFIFQK